MLTNEEIQQRNAGKARVLALLQDGNWHSTHEINEAAGSSEGTRRLRELRKANYPIKDRRNPEYRRQWQYRLTV